MSRETVRPTEFPPPEANPAGLPPLPASPKKRRPLSRRNPYRQASRLTSVLKLACPHLKAQPPFFHAVPHSCALRRNSPLLFSITYAHWDNRYFDEPICFQFVAHTWTKTPRVGGGTLKCYLIILLDRAANPCTINTSVKYVRNSSRINTHKNAGLKVPWNQHLQKKPGGV
jgi:hypothetical protein